MLRRETETSEEATFVEDQGGERDRVEEDADNVLEPSRAGEMRGPAAERASTGFSHDLSYGSEE